MFDRKKKKSPHLDLTKQIFKNLPLGNYCMGDYGSADNKLHYLTYLMQ